MNKCCYCEGVEGGGGGGREGREREGAIQFFNAP